MHAQIQNLLPEGGGGGGSKPNGEKTALIFMFVFGFLVQNLPGMRGVQLFTGGGGPNANFYRI